MQDSKDMSLHPHAKKKSEINLQVVEEEEVTSIDTKLARKKYTGEFRVLLTVTVMIMRKLPSIVKMQKTRNMTKRTFRSFGFFLRPERTK